MARGHVVVVGGGVIGVATAYYLAKRGVQVTLLEQSEICSGASSGNAAQVTPGHLPLPQPGTLVRNLRWLLNSRSPLFVAPRLDLSLLRWLIRFQQACNPRHLHYATKILCELGAASMPLFEALVDELNIDFHHEGRLEVCRTERTFGGLCREAELLKECGFDYERLDGKQLRDREPAIEADVAGAVYFPDSASCNPHTFVTRLAEAARREGAVLREQAPVTGCHIEQGRLSAVDVNHEPIEADAAVLACGAWGPQLARRLGLRLPVQPGKGYHLDVERPKNCPRYPVVLMDERIFVSPVDDFFRMAGTMEFSGFNLKLRPERVEMLRSGTSRYFPGVSDAAVRSQWCHLRPMTPDGLPVIGLVPRCENVWIATGHGMLGYTQGPITGQLLAQWITDGRTQMDMTPLRPSRFRRRG